MKNKILKCIISILTCFTCFALFFVIYWAVSHGTTPNWVLGISMSGTVACVPLQLCLCLLD